MEPRRYGPFPFSPITKRPPLKWPGGARIALWIIPNIEIFHLNVRMPGDAQERPKDTDPIPAVRHWSQRDYGNRVGIWRIMEVLERHGVRATAALNSDICADMPIIFEECMRLGWEIIGHGKTNSLRLNEVGPDAERALIRECLDTITAATGKRPVGWLGSGLQETWHTLDNLIDCGCRYVADWVNDDQPYVMNVDGRKIVSMPYPFELNDSAALLRNKWPMTEFERMIKDTFDVLYREGAASGRVMAISLHPFVIGHPHRIAVLDRALEYILSHAGVWPATGSEIVEAYLSQLD